MGQGPHPVPGADSSRRPSCSASRTCWRRGGSRSTAARSTSPTSPPMLSVIGEKDHIVPPAARRRSAGSAGSAEFEELRSPAGHVGLMVGAPPRSATCRPSPTGCDDTAPARRLTELHDRPAATRHEEPRDEREHHRHVSRRWRSAATPVDERALRDFTTRIPDGDRTFSVEDPDDPRIARWVDTSTNPRWIALHDGAVVGCVWCCAASAGRNTSARCGSSSPPPPATRHRPSAHPQGGDGCGERG